MKLRQTFFLGTPDRNRTDNKVLGGPRYIHLTTGAFIHLPVYSIRFFDCCQFIIINIFRRFFKEIFVIIRAEWPIYAKFIK